MKEEEENPSLKLRVLPLKIFSLVHDLLISTVVPSEALNFGGLGEKKATARKRERRVASGGGEEI